MAQTIFATEPATPHEGVPSIPVDRADRLYDLGTVARLGDFSHGPFMNGP